VNEEDVPTHDERLLAAVCHGSQLLAGILVPLFLYFVYRERSRFIAFHALQAIVWHVGLWVMWFVASVGAMVMAVLVATASQVYAAHDGGVVRFLMGGGISFGMAVFLALPAVVYAVYAFLLTLRARRGGWSGYPIVGRLVRV
jgi:uncharacterized protein